MPTPVTETGGKPGWFDAIRSILRFQRGASAPVAAPRRSGKRRRAGRAAAAPVQRQLPHVQKLAGDGVPTPEIARRTGLSQDIVSMLLHLRPLDSAESSGQGTFFRILQARIAS